MLDVAVIEDPAAAEASLDPVRARLLAELAEPQSASMLATRIGLPRQKVNYHLRTLERHGLVELVEERRKGNMTERMLQASASAYVISPAALGSAQPDPEHAPDQLSARWLVAIAGRTLREVGVLIAGAAAARKRLATFTIDAQVRFATAADRAAFADELATCVSGLVARYHDAGAPGGRAHRLVVVVHPAATGQIGQTGQTAPETAPRVHSRVSPDRQKEPEMGHEFTTEDELELVGSPEEVWNAIASGPGMDAWFLGRNEVTPGIGGSVQSDFAGGVMPVSTITTWEPPHRLVTASPTAPDGRFLAYEYLVEARGEGASVLRIVTSGFLPGDDWEAEFEAMRAGGCVFRSALAEYITHFAGRKAHPFTVFGPPVDDWTATWKIVDDTLGLTSLMRGTPARLAVSGQPAISGVLYASNDQSRSIRTHDALYRILQGFSGGLVLCHVSFTAPDQPAVPEPDQAEHAWRAWIGELGATHPSTSLQIGSSS